MDKVQIVEVGPRDGFQSVGPFIPTDRKQAIIHALYDAGIRRMEAAAFVSPSAVPQMADAAEIVAATNALAGLDAQMLVPTVRHAERGLDARARHLVFVLSVSERHNQSNVRRSPAESAGQYEELVRLAKDRAKLRLNLATAFDCPFDGRVADGDVIALLDRLVAAAPDAEIALCDTTGRADPAQVTRLFGEVIRRFPAIRWAFHGHDTYGLGAANALAAWTSGVRIFDASVAGLGGCPFAPGATGNVATEDLVWMFERMGVSTGIDLDALVRIGADIVGLPGAQTGGRVRDALSATGCKDRVNP
ncbi:MAG: hydroxymethylglutaryl-CoA lyase [Sphingobium sp.]